MKTDEFKTNDVNSKVNKVKLDREYSCVWIEELKWLSEHGIKYTFVKEVNGVTIWKYKKNSELFHALAEFYDEVYTK